MSRLLALALAALIMIAPAVSFAQSAPAAGGTSSYSDTAPKKKAKAHHAKKAKKAKKAAADATAK